MKTIVSKISVCLACCLLLTACATPKPTAMTGSESYATLYTPPTKCVMVGMCAPYVGVQAVNGKAIPKFATKYNHTVSAGEISVVARVLATLGTVPKGKVGVCELEWTAQPGTLYTLERHTAEENFVITAKAENETVATCDAPFEDMPRGAVVPIIIPVR